MSGIFGPENQRPLYDAPAVRLMASAAARRGQLTKAGRLYWNLLAGNPGDREARLMLVALMITRDQPIDALVLLEEALAQQPGDAQMTERKAFILALLGRLDESLEIYSGLVAALPEVPALLVVRGNILLALGRQQAAVDDYRRAIQHDPAYGEAWWALANIKTVSVTNAEIGWMKSLLAQGNLSPASRINIEYSLGKAFEDAGVPNLSFAHYRQANDLQSVDAFNAREATARHVEEVTRWLRAEDFLREDGHPSEAPIFIVGMPRSGTTLVEQILASHPDVEGTGELPTISAIARSLVEGLGGSEFDYAKLLKSYPGETLRKLGETYLRQAAAYRRTQRPCFIDKMPSNWMHVGLIRLILPRARIVDIRRDPLDCCFSNYAQNYPRGHEFTHSLEDLGAHYRDYERLIDHWDMVAPGAVTRVQYEHFVEKPDETIRDLLTRLGLPFAESCLRFFENKRAVRTPSSEQVRQPINRRGIGRWRPYAPWLGPLIEALGPGGA